MTIDKRGEFLTKTEIDAALKVLGEYKNIALCGGLAMQLYGSNRLTFDVDILADEPLPGLPDKGALSFGGYLSEIDGVPVDIIIRNDRSQKLYEAALAKARRLPAVPIPVVTANFLAVLKLHAARRKDEMDLETLLVTPHVDIEAACGIAEEFMGYYAADVLKRAYEAAHFRREFDERRAKALNEMESGSR